MEEKEVNLKEVYDRMMQQKKERKKLAAYLREQMDASTTYKKMQEELKLMKERKKNMDAAFQAEQKDVYTQMDKIDKDVKSDKELLTDIAVNKMLKQEPVELVDENNNKYVPYFSVTFKKVN